MNDEREGLKVKLRITIDGKAYEAEVEILERTVLTGFCGLPANTDARCSHSIPCHQRER